MAYRKFEMYKYKQIIYRLQKGESQRSIARLGFGSRDKINDIAVIASKHNWLTPASNLPHDQDIAKAFAEGLFSTNNSFSYIFYFFNPSSIIISYLNTCSY